MRKLPLLGVLVVASVVAAALPAEAAPRHGNSATEITLLCDDDVEVHGLVQFETGSAAVFAADMAIHGRQYVLSHLEDRIVDSETDELLLASEKSWGQRKGFTETLTCTGSVDLTEFGVTWFGDSVVLKGK